MKTEPIGPGRKRAIALALGLILLLAAGLRLWRVNFGLPALNDPDEPVFVMTALDMLREHRLDPQWFGHPATTLLYCLALIFVAIGLIGSGLGHWHGTQGFVAAVFADPGLAILPMRLLIVACGVATVYQTYRIGRQAAGARVGLIAALLLACNPLHVELSQVIRSDMLATLFMLWSTRHALVIAQGAPPRAIRRHAIVAGIAAGLACATKWPALLVLANPGAAIVWRVWLHRARFDHAAGGRTIRLLGAVGLVALATLVIVSPYVVLDYPVVLHDLHGEARAQHLDATGHGFVGNLWWYLRLPLAGSFGVAGMLLTAIGVPVVIARHRALAVAALPASLLLLIVIAAQSLIWARWAVPLLPAVALLIAVAIDAVRRAVQARRPVQLALLIVLALPMIVSTFMLAGMRAHDTRQAATAWVRSHVPRDRSVLIEQASFDLVSRPGRLLFPLGEAGCIDVHQALGARPSYAHVDRLRRGRAIVDLGNVASDRLAGCRADVLVLSHYGRYRDAGGRFAPQLANYRALLRGRHTIRTFSPVPGVIGGPEVTVALQ
eukprot:gene10330-10396_t